MRKRVALKILKMKDKLRYKPQQILEAEKVAKRFGLTAGEDREGIEQAARENSRK